MKIKTQNILKIAMIVNFCLTMLSFGLKALLGVRVDAAGVIHEPFFLLPLGYFFFSIGIILLISWISVRKH